MLYAGGEAVAGPQVMGHLDAATQAATQRPETAAADLTILSVVAVLGTPLAVGLFLWRRWYRLGSAPPRPEALLPFVGLGMFFGVLLAGLAGGYVAQRVFVENPLAGGGSDWVLHDQAKVRLGTYVAQLVVLAAFLRLGWRATTRSSSRRPGLLLASLIGTGALLVFWPMVTCAAYAAGYLVKHLGDESVDPIAHETLNLLLSSPVDGWFFVMAALVVIAAPLIEEVMYRGILQRVMVQVGMGRWPAIIATSAIFALMHVDVAQWHAVAAIFVLSVGFGWVYEKTGRLAAAVTMHALFNAANLALAPLLVPGLC